MKRASRYLCTVLLAVAYVFAYMGFGVHTCHEDGSRHLVWLLGDVSCEAIHHHSHDTDHDHHHDDGCCSTHVYVLTDAQDQAPDCDRMAASESTVFLPVAVDIQMPTLMGHHVAFSWDSPPPDPVLTQPLLSVWRV